MLQSMVIAIAHTICGKGMASWQCSNRSWVFNSSRVSNTSRGQM